jgi:hypothetical protein
MRWTSIALFTAIDCTDFELGDGGVKGDRAIELLKLQDGCTGKV